MAVERLRGMQLWKLRAKHGRDKIFATAAIMEEHARAYFEWCDDHPRVVTELVKYKDGFELVDMPLKRPYTFDGLTSYLGVSYSYFDTARRQLREKVEKGNATNEDKKILDVIDWIFLTIRNEQIEGALVGQYKEGLTARLNGVADNINQNNNGASIVRVVVRDQETADNMSKLEDLL